MQKIKFYYFLLFFFFIGKITAQETTSYNEEVIVDSLADNISYGEKQIDSAFATGYKTNNSIFPKKINPDFRKKYKTPEFDYTTTKPQVSLWERFWQWVEQFFRDIFGQPNPQKTFNYTEAILKFLAILLIGFVLYLVLSYLINKNGNYFFSKKNKKLNIETNDLVENIHEINFLETITKLEQEKDYRSAIRYHFLHTLKKFTDKKWIDWNPEKTNKDYAREITNLSQKSIFLELSYIYDYVWYGEFDINEYEYEIFKKKFI